MSLEGFLLHAFILYLGKLSYFCNNIEREDHVPHITMLTQIIKHSSSRRLVKGRVCEQGTPVVTISLAHLLWFSLCVSLTVWDHPRRSFNSMDKGSEDGLYPNT
jgi:hypothetical protein